MIQPLPVSDFKYDEDNGKYTDEFILSIPADNEMVVY